MKPYDAPEGFDWVTRLVSWKMDHGALRLDLETFWGRRARARLEVLDPHIFRWTFFAPGAWAGPRIPGSGIVRRPVRAPGWSVKPRPGGISVTSPGLTLEIDADPWAVRFLDKRGRRVFDDNPGDTDGLGRPFVLPLGYVRENRKPGAVTQSFHLRPDEHLYGLGEKFTRLDKVPQRVVSWTVDALGSTSERSHKNIPFLWSTRGWGLFLDTGARVTWELGTRSTQSFTVKVEGGVLDAYVIHGPSPAAILERYAGLTGQAPVPPKWSFGLWMSSGGTYRTQGEIDKLVDGLAEHDLPADVIHIDPWWMRWRHYCDFRWDREAFPNPESLIRKLHGLGLKLCLWEHPYISVESDLFALGRRKCYFVRRPDGGIAVIDYGLSLVPRPDGVVRRAGRSDSWNARVAIIDLTNPSAMEWFKDLHRPLLRMGVDVFKTDFGEDIPEDAAFFDGRTGATMHNLYPLLYNRAVSDVTREERGGSLIWSRSGTAGSQHYPVGWSGDPAADWDSLAATIRGGLSLGMSGIPFWSNDIGGYRGRPDPALYVRWAQFGLLCSHSRMHGDSPREPWVFGKEALEIVRKFVRLRYRLFPYYYSLAHEAARTGMPVLRAMPLAFPKDPSAHGQDHQFMIGPWLLAAPVYEESGRRPVYLPEGRWFDFWTGRPIDGPRALEVKTPLSRMPLFVREGAILPTMRPAARIPEGRIDPLIVEVWPVTALSPVDCSHGRVRRKRIPGQSPRPQPPDPVSKFTLYEDEGRTQFCLSTESGQPGLAWKGPRQKSRVLVRFKIR